MVLPPGKIGRYLGKPTRVTHCQTELSGKSQTVDMTSCDACSNMVEHLKSDILQQNWIPYHVHMDFVTASPMLPYACRRNSELAESGASATDFSNLFQAAMPLALVAPAHLYAARIADGLGGIMVFDETTRRLHMVAPFLQPWGENIT